MQAAELLSVLYCPFPDGTPNSDRSPERDTSESLQAILGLPLWEIRLSQTSFVDPASTAPMAKSIETGYMVPAWASSVAGTA
jgi:hypothetical protein